MRLSAFSRRKHRVNIVVVLVVVTVLFHLIVVLYIVGNGCVTLGGLSVNQDITRQALNHPRFNSSEKDSGNTYVDYSHGHSKANHRKDIQPHAHNFITSQNSMRDSANRIKDEIQIKHRKDAKTVPKLNRTSAERYHTRPFPESENARDTFLSEDIAYRIGNSLPYNCSTISRLKLLHPIGRGISKQTFVAELGNGVKVAVKMVTRHVQGIKECLEKYKSFTKTSDKSDESSHFGYYEDNENDVINGVKKNSNNLANDNDSHYDYVERSRLRSEHSEDNEMRLLHAKRCYLPATSKLLKEIMMSMEISHRNLATLLGFCVRNEVADSTDMSMHGVMAVYELGSRFYMDSLQILPWQMRIQHALEMAELLVYLENSPLGSLIMPDMKEAHLIKVKDTIKLIDLDDVTNLEPSCSMEGHGRIVKACKLNTECIGNLCEGFNARHNLRTFNTHLFKRLLFPLTFPDPVIHRVGQLNARLDSLTLNAHDLRKDIIQIMENIGVDVL